MRLYGYQGAFSLGSNRDRTPLNMHVFQYSNVRVKGEDSAGKLELSPPVVLLLSVYCSVFM